MSRLHWWKSYPPGWFAFEEFDYESEFGEGGGGGDGGGDDDDEEEEEYDGGESWSPPDYGDDDEDDGDGGRNNIFDDDDDEERARDFEREMERERERQREEFERQQAEQRAQEQADEQRRQLEERQRQIEEEQRRQQEQYLDQDGDGIPDQGQLTQGEQFAPSGDPALDDRLRQQFEGYQEQNQQFDVSTPEAREAWLLGTPPPITQAGSNGRDINEYLREQDQRRAAELARENDPTRVFTPAMGGPAYSGPPNPIPEAIRSEPPPPDRQPTPVGAGAGRPDLPAVAAQAAAGAAAAAGGSPQQIAETAETAARMAYDRQTLGQQSAWTRQAFRSTYGANAEQEWIRQHNAELERNRQIYGSYEPQPGAPAPPGSGLPAAPDRRIGRTPPPGPGQTGQYGINTNVAPAVQAAAAASAAAPAAAQAVPGAVQPIPGAPTAPTILPPGPRLPGQPREPEPGLGAGSYPPAVAPQPGSEGPSRERGTLPSLQPPITEGPSRERGTLPSLQPPAPAPVPDSGSGDWDLAPALVPPSPPAPSPAAERVPDIVDPFSPMSPSPYDDEGLEDIVGQRGPSTVAELRQMQALSMPSVSPGAAAPVRYDAQGRPIPSAIETVQPREIPTYGMAGEYEPVYTDPVIDAVYTDRPLAALARLAAEGKGPGYDASRDAFHIAHGIAALLRGDTDESGKPVGAWAEPYVNDVARLSWAREEAQNGRASDPRNAPVDYIEQWKNAFYGSSNNPDERVPLVREVNQAMIDAEASRTPPNQPFDWRAVYGQDGTGIKGPNGQQGPQLILPQRTLVDCGPTAIAALLRSRGYNAEVGATFQYTMRTPSGDGRMYHTGERGAWTGPQNMVKFIREELGMEATSVSVTPSGVNWDQIDRELAEGRPVLLSSPGHYWTLSAKDAQGRYHAGASSVGGNGAWLPRTGFFHGGAPDTAVFVRGDVDPNSRAVRTMGLQPPTGTGSQDTRAFLSTQTMGYQTPGQRATTRIAAEMAAPQEPENFGDYVRWSATKRGLDADQVAAVMGKEGPEGWTAVGRFNTGTSYGPLQLHYAGGSNPKAGMGDRFTKLTGIDLRTVDPRTPAGVAAHKRAVDYALDELSRVGDFREWYGADNAFPASSGGAGRFTKIKRVQQAQRGPGGQGEIAPFPDPASPGSTQPGAYQGARRYPTETAPEWIGEARPEGDLRAGEARGIDLGARVLDVAYEMTGDARFAMLTAGLINGEGGFSGREDEYGATGIFQFDPRFNEAKLFKQWLQEQGINEPVGQAARKPEYAMGYYLPFIKDAYDDAVARGVTDDIELLRAMVVGPSRRGYGHNSKSSGANFQNYVNGLREFKQGQFRLLSPKRWR